MLLMVKNNRMFDSGTGESVKLPKDPRQLSKEDVQKLFNVRVIAQEVNRLGMLSLEEQSA